MFKLDMWSMFIIEMVMSCNIKDAFISPECMSTGD
jgi:hypothetical protein